MVMPIQNRGTTVVSQTVPLTLDKAFFNSPLHLSICSINQVTIRLQWFPFSSVSFSPTTEVLPFVFVQGENIRT